MSLSSDGMSVRPSDWQRVEVDSIEEWCDRPKISPLVSHPAPASISAAAVSKCRLMRGEVQGRNTIGVSGIQIGASQQDFDTSLRALTRGIQQWREPPLFISPGRGSERIARVPEARCAVSVDIGIVFDQN